jgi:hypothetical protein
LSFGYRTDRFGRERLFLINGSFWLGTMFGASLSLLLLSKDLFPVNLGWELAFGLGAVLGLGGGDRPAARGGRRLAQDPPAARHRLRGHRPHRLQALPQRTVLGLSLFIGQAFLYNFAFGNLLGPLLLGRLFDSVGRRPMITLCYVLSGVLLVGTGLLFNAGALSAATLTACWVVVFFFASAGASTAYLTGSEIFPMETRAMALAFFYYLPGAVLMIAAGIAEWFIGVEAAGKSLEDVAKPLTAHEEEAEAPA